MFLVKEEEGKKQWRVKKKIPFSFACSSMGISLDTIKPENSLPSCEELISEEKDIRSENINKQSQNNPEGSFYKINGIASSTSKDWHGTEMSLPALKEMKEQFDKGVPYLPTHSDNEWNDVIGKTEGAEIYRDNTLENQNDEEEGYSLRVNVLLYKEEEIAEKLYKRVKRGEKVGMSIGGWFKEIDVIENEDGDIERVIVNDLQLDHLATTRNPSNPDSYISDIKRHIEYIKQEEDGYLIKVAKVSEESSKDGGELYKVLFDNSEEEQHVVNNSATCEKLCAEEDSSLDKAEINLHNNIKDARRSVNNNLQNLDMEFNMSENVTHDTINEEREAEVVETRYASKESFSELEAKITSLERSLTTLVDVLAVKQEEKEEEERSQQEDVKTKKINYLEERVKALTEKVVAVATPSRRSVISTGGDKTSYELKNEYSSLIRRAKQELGESSALVNVAESQISRRSAEKNKVSDYHTLESDLISILRAAIADGIITEPHARNNWK
tara:strand:- start:37595 stop:39094 length:1500 start_codon:yes stop_codon:yes gene_type:complete